MYNKKYFIGLVIIALVIFWQAWQVMAANENAYRDGNRVPTTLGVNSSNETRNLLTDDDGKLMVGELATVTLVTNVASGTFALTDGTQIALIDTAGNLNVNATGSITVSGSVTVSATDLDIRNLTAASDAVTIQGGNTVDVSIDDGGNTITVDGTVITTATDLDIRDLTAASDSVTIQGGNTVDVSIDDGGNTITVDGSVTVSATNLDIRDLTSASDSVTIEGGNTTDVKVTLDSEAVTLTRLATFEYVNSNVGIGATATIAATANSYVASVYNGGAGSIFVILCDDATCTGETVPAANVGLEIPAGSGKVWENIVARAVYVYNEDAATADVSVEWRR